MRAACEELRIGVGDGGRLYRQAVSRKGVFGGPPEKGGIGEGAKGTYEGRGGEGMPTLVGNGGVPIEYARHQVEGPGRGGWDHGWTR